jgi:hypothetical protein
MGSEQEDAAVERMEEQEERSPKMNSPHPETGLRSENPRYLHAEQPEASKMHDVPESSTGQVDDSRPGTEDTSTDSLPEVPDISGSGHGDGGNGSSLRRSCVGCTQARKKVGSSPRFTEQSDHFRYRV